MKNSKIFAGLSVILLGSAAAFATAKQTALSTVYYNDPSNQGKCAIAEAEICQAGSANCIVQVTLDGGATFLSARQIYSGFVANAPCATPYTKQP
jgi:hypothetical protein